MCVSSNMSRWWWEWRVEEERSRDSTEAEGSRDEEGSRDGEASSKTVARRTEATRARDRMDRSCAVECLELGLLDVLPDVLPDVLLVEAEVENIVRGVASRFCAPGI